MRVLTRIIGVVILIGFAMVVVGLITGFDFNSILTIASGSEEYGEIKSASTSQEIHTISFTVDTRSVVFHLVDDDHVRLTYYEHETKDIWTFDDTNGVYTITQKEKPQWFNIFNFRFISEEIKTIHVHLPKNNVYTINTQTAVGSIRMQFDSDQTFNQLTLESNTGSIYLKHILTPLLTLDTDTGSIDLQDVKVDGNAILDSDTGSLSLIDVTTANLDLSTDTGSIILSRVLANDLNARVSTGKISINQSSFQGDIKAQTSTGDVTITQSVATNYHLRSSTGDIKMTIADTSLFRYDLKTSTGTIRVDGTNQGNRHTTTTGSILVKAEVSTGSITIITGN